MPTSETSNMGLCERSTVTPWSAVRYECVVTAEGIRFGRPLNFDEWRDCGRDLVNGARSLPWWIGDWLAFGRRLFCDRDEATGQFKKGKGTSRYEAAVAATGLDPSTLATYCYVSASIPILLRRKPGELSWSHHREVAPLKPKEIETWLARAAAKEWSVSELRQAIRHENAECGVQSAESGQEVPIYLTRVATDFERCLRKLEGDVESWPAERRRVVKLDLGKHIEAARKFYEKL